jgi:hypothetical protein
MGAFWGTEASHGNSSLSCQAEWFNKKASSFEGSRTGNFEDAGRALSGLEVPSSAAHSPHSTRMVKIESSFGLLGDFPRHHDMRS